MLKEVTIRAADGTTRTAKVLLVVAETEPELGEYVNHRLGDVLCGYRPLDGDRVVHVRDVEGAAAPPPAQRDPDQDDQQL
jgi:hypothetical protein